MEVWIRSDKAVCTSIGTSVLFLLALSHLSLVKIITEANVESFSEQLV